MVEEERRHAENAALRELVDSLRSLITVRDELGSVGMIGRIFKTARYRKALSAYDGSIMNVRNAIQALMAAAKPADKSGLAKHQADLFKAKSAISLEEFFFLLGKPDKGNKSSGGEQPPAG